MKSNEQRSPASNRSTPRSTPSPATPAPTRGLSSSGTGSSVSGSTVCVPAQVAVDGGAGDAELGRDLVHGVAAPAVVAGFFVHLAGQFHLSWPEFGFLSAGAAAGACGRESVDGAFGHQGVFEL